MCVNGELVSALEVMNARWDYRGHRSMKMVDGVMSMGMMVVVEMVISCHGFLYVRYFLDFEFLSFYGFWLMVMDVI